MPLTPGARLGPYEVAGLIGAGGMGEVYRARDTRLDRMVALKVLPPEFASDPTLRARFEREAHAISALQYPHICKLHDVGEQDGQAYLVTELLDGAFLPEVLSAGLFMTYRTRFILLDMMDNFATAIRLRGGFTPGNFLKNGSNFAKGIGALLVRAVERSGRLYAVMAVRGYSGSMAERSIGTIGRNDWLPAGTGMSILALALWWN